MKIHFMAAVTGKQDRYKTIIDVIKNHGHSLVTDHYLNRKLSDIKQETPADSELYAKRVQNWLKQADIVIFEATLSDVNVGFELALAMNMSKPVIVMYHKVDGDEPFSLKGIHSDRLQLLPYDEKVLEEMLVIALEYAQETSDVRFNFFITPTISTYLDWVAKEKKIPRSVYLRRLIEREMEENEEYAA